MVVTSTAGAFCEELAVQRPPSCGGDAVPVLGARTGDLGLDTIVINARFLVRRSTRGLHDVTVLPDGYTGVFEVRQEQGSG